MKILLDTNFILACVRQKIDFVSLADEMFDEEVEWVVPMEVEGELKDLAGRRGEKIEDGDAARVGLQLVKNFDKVPLGMKNVDAGIVRYAKNNKVVVATLDRELKEKLKGNKILTIRAGKKLEVV